MTNKADYWWYKEHGICTRCHEEPVKDGHSMCWRCLANRRDYDKIRYHEQGRSDKWKNQVRESPEKAAEAWNTRASGWISCSERMPEEDGEYLLVSNGEIKVLPYMDGEFYNDWPSAFRHWDKISVNVTHWIPLPEPPKAEGKA